MQKTAMHSLHPAALYPYPATSGQSRKSESGNRRLTAKMLKIMRLLVLFMFVCFLSAHASGVSQTVTVSGKNIPLQQVFAAIEKQTGYVVFFNRSLLHNTKPVTINATHAPLRSFLNNMLANQPVSYKIEGKTIFISRKKAGDNSEGQTTVTAEEMEAAFAPDPVVTGVVRNSKGEPLSGAAVKLQGRGAGTSTDDKGRFSLQATQGQLIVISFTGYKDKLVAVTGGTLQVTLEAVENVLDEVVVGYGSVKKKDFTGSVAQVNMVEMQKQNVFNFDVALAGRAPGVQVVKSSGVPGADAAIRIRGASSVFGVNEPLYVIDGVPVQLSQGMGATDYFTSRARQISPLATINPQDIESIDILKDASSTAIYGSRAANGVIIVNTKKGKGGMKSSATLGYNAAFDRFVKEFDMLSSSELFEVATEAYKNNGQQISPDFLIYKGVSTDWQKLVLRQSYSEEWNTGLRGGSANGETIYSLSAAASNQRGVIKATGVKRYSLRGSVESQVAKVFKLGVNMSYSNSSNENTNSYLNIVMYRPDIPVYDANGNYAYSSGDVNGNPVARTTYTVNMKNDALLLTGFAEVKPFSFLKLRSAISMNKNQNTQLNYTPSYHPSQISIGRRGARTDGNLNSQSVVFDNTVTYNSFFKKHYINAIAGASFTADKRDMSTVNSINFPDDNILTNLGSAGSILNYSSSANASGLESYLGRLDYNFDGRYYLTFTARTDKSTKFGPDNQWGFFPSTAIAWRISKERFLNKASWLSDLKLRASYGKTGIANLADFLYASFFSTGTNRFYNGQSGVGLTNVPNSSIRWETSNQLDIGFDYSLFGNKLRGSFEYYYKATKDLLLNSSIPFETGFTTATTNMGNISNRGVELVIAADVVSKKNFTYVTDFNISLNRSRLDKLNGGTGISILEGEPLGVLKGYKTAGLFQTAAEIAALNSKSPNGFYQAAKTSPGDFKFVDQNGDGYISTSDMVNLGSTDAKFYGGWNHVFRYKALETSVFFYYSYGQYLENRTKINLGIYTYDQNYFRSLLNAWRPDNTETTQPRNVRSDPNTNGRTSDYTVQDASFFKLKNFQVAYYLNPGKFTGNIINQVKVYASVQNLFIITKYDGIDPEVSLTNSGRIMPGGWDAASYPSTRTFNVGFNINF